MVARGAQEEKGKVVDVVSLPSISLIMRSQAPSALPAEVLSGLVFLEELSILAKACMAP